MILLAIDPGVHECGWALFGDGNLAACGLGPLDVIKYVQPIDAVIVEVPQIYRASHSKGDPNDLINVARIVGMVEALWGDKVRVVKPREWKGQVPKTVHHARNPLSPHEKTLLPKLPKSLIHNVVDAVLLGKWYWAKI